MTFAPDPDPDDIELDEDEEAPELGWMEVSVTEPELLGVLLDHRGEVLRALYDRRIVPFGFNRS